MEDKKALKDKKQLEAEIKRLKEIRKEYALTAEYMGERHQRIASFLERPSAKKWSAKKRAKMIRRLSEGISEERNALGVVEQADFKLKHVSGA